MAPTQIRIDSNIKREATALFSNLGLDMSNALNAIAEARKISRDPDITGYNSMEELKAALDD